QGVDSHAHGVWTQILTEVVGHDEGGLAPDGVVVERVTAGNPDFTARAGVVFPGLALSPEYLGEQVDPVTQVLLTIDIEIPALLRRNALAVGIVVLQILRAGHQSRRGQVLAILACRDGIGLRASWGTDQNVPRIRQEVVKVTAPEGAQV